jgi:SAM-dependent methyltransferase
MYNRFASRLASFLNNRSGKFFANLPRSYLGKYCVAYVPDSKADFGQHPELTHLWSKYTFSNRANNGGDFFRFFSLILNIKSVIGDDVKGDFAELGVWRGNTAAIMAHYARRSSRQLYLFDTFTGFSSSDLTGIDTDKRQGTFSDTSITAVSDLLKDDAECCHFIAGHFPGSFPDSLKDKSFAVVSIDCDLYAPAKAALDVFYRHMPLGGIFLIHDYSSGHWNGIKMATDEFCARNGERLILMPDKSGSAFIRRCNKSDA